jgi:hypothetical protein
MLIISGLATHYYWTALFLSVKQHAEVYYATTDTSGQWLTLEE